MTSFTARTLLIAALTASCATAGLAASAAVPSTLPSGEAAQASFEQVVQELGSRDATVRLRAVRLLKDAAYPEAAIPIAALLTDANDAVRYEAIAAELNTFLAERVVTRKHVALVVEVRTPIDAHAEFSKGPLAIGPRPVPIEVLGALRRASRDANPRIAVEALYAFGTLGVEPSGARRRALLAESGSDLDSMIGIADLGRRYAVIRVIGRVFEWRSGDRPIDPLIGDAIVAAVNDPEKTIKLAAIEALGAMRYDRAVSALIEQFQFYGKGEVAEAALSALARIAHPASELVLAAQLSSGNAALKVSAIEGLARIGDRSRYPSIQSALRGETDERLTLAGALAAVLLADAPLDPLAESLRRPRLAERARDYLAAVAAGRSATLFRYAQDPDPQIRTGVADAVGLAGDPAALPLVEGLLKDRDPHVVVSAERAAARLRAVRAAA
jgi:HEAT repeat protein